MTFKPHPQDCDCCHRCGECNVHCDCPWADEPSDPSDSGREGDDEGEVGQRNGQSVSEGSEGSEKTKSGGSEAHTTSSSE
jgi:hypothetical protein